MSVRNIVDDALGRIGRDGPTLCFICRSPLDERNAVDLEGEPCHRDCVRSWQFAGRLHRGGRR